jgi:hypothetical protein
MSFMRSEWMLFAEALQKFIFYCVIIVKLTVLEWECGVRKYLSTDSKKKKLFHIIVFWKRQLFKIMIQVVNFIMVPYTTKSFYYPTSSFDIIYMRMYERSICFLFIIFSFIVTLVIANSYACWQRIEFFAINYRI